MDPREIARQVAAHGTDPGWWRHVAAPFAVRTAFLRPYYRFVSRGSPDDFMAEDWDNLVILDACRYDLFAERFDGPGRLETRRSPGSNTPEFLRRTFGDRTFEDVVYVTANPQVNLHAAETFHAVENVWETEWDDELNTVLPGPMVEATLDAYERYPNKRLIAHFVQPHYPFVGEFGREHLGDQVGLGLSKELAEAGDRPTEHDHVWLRLRSGRADEAVVRRAYRENFDVVWPHVRRLLDAFDEPTVVTADHGNSFGARATPLGVPVWGHPPGVYMPELVTVPWLAVDGPRRKELVAEPATAGERTDRDAAEQRLRHLGYVT